MITEDYVSFEVAKLLKEKGFESDECIAIYDLGDNNAFIRDSGIFENGPEDYLEFQWGEEWRRFGYYLAPTLQMAMKWLREEKGVFISICNGNHKKDNRDTSTPDNVYYFFVITDARALYDEEKQCYKEFISYEEACESAIKYCLESLI